MPKNVYSEINLHMNWHTKNNEPVLVEIVEARLHQYLHHRALETKGVRVHAIGGTADHVHMAVTIPPNVTISEWIGQLKGAGSHHINHEICNRKVLAWQDGYGVVSFGTRNLPWIVNYVNKQKEHHARGQIYDRLERIDSLDESPSGPDRGTDNGDTESPLEAG